MGNLRAETTPAKIISCDVGLDSERTGDNNIALTVIFDYGESQQAIDRWVDIEFLSGFLKACGVKKISQTVGRVVNVLHDLEGIRGIDPMPFDKGVPFSIENWTHTDHY
jgi:hypothetical protein